jgi:acetyltransferase-like isoleucine patch superfamily enzyme
MLLQNIIIPQDSVNDEKVLIVTTFFKDGDEVKIGDQIIEYETSKAIISIEAEQNGFVFYNCMAGDYVFIGTSVAEINIEKIKSEKVPNIVVGDSSNSIKNTKDEKIQTLFSNKAKKLLIQNEIAEDIFYGVDLVNEEDVLLYISKLNIKKPKSADIKIYNPKCDISQANDNRERIIIVCPSLIGMEVIFDILEGQNNIDIIGYVADDNHKENINLPFLDCNIDDFHEKINHSDYDGVVIAMAGSLKSMQFRKKVFDKFMEKGIKFTNIISNKANISQNVTIGIGNIIGSGVFIGTGSQIGDNNFISYMTTIGHHNKIGTNNLFAPGVMMSGLVEVGDDCILTTGVNFIDKVKIGNRVILPLGFNVIKNLSDDTIIKIKN